MTERTSSTDLPQGTVFGPYLIVRILGRGGMGAVYEAVHTGLEKRVALKTLVSELVSEDEARERFTREARAAAQLRHPHVVDVSDVGVHDGVPYLAMEYLEGEGLSQRLEREGALDPEALADVMLPVCSAVAAAHDAHIVHRDLKPDNIFLARSRPGVVVPKLLDFGIAKQSNLTVDGGLTKTNSLLGTPHYMAPEQARGAKSTDARSDQFSLGVILYQCATGALPFDGEGLYGVLHAIISEPFAPPRAVRPEVPAGFEAVILKAMERDPAERFRDVRALGSALLPFASPATRALWEGEFRGVAPYDTTTVIPSAAASPVVAHSTLSTIEKSAPGLRAPKPRGALVGALGLVGALALVGAAVFGVSRFRGGAPDVRPTAVVRVAPVRAPTPPPPPTPPPSPVTPIAASPTPEVALVVDAGPGTEPEAPQRRRARHTRPPSRPSSPSERAAGTNDMPY